MDAPQTKQAWLQMLADCGEGAEVRLGAYTYDLEVVTEGLLEARERRAEVQVLLDACQAMPRA
eukprot:11632724-Alexandrium_andersonii.AAC.1